jgi:adenine-specific DNA-methyltransferase
MPESLLTFAKQMRHAPTDAEACLWRYLRAGRLKEHRFKRQKPLGAYIVDFVCLERSLIVEVDGGQHVDRAKQDAVRTHWLESQGFTVLRFWNDEVLRNTDAVLDVIVRALEPGRD